MTDTLTESPLVADLPGGPYDVEFFFDAGCPFAWQTSVWLRRVAELRDLKVGWRFISLWYINIDAGHPQPMRDAAAKTLRYHRICAAARDQLGNEAVGDLYRAFGERYWSAQTDADDVLGKLAAAAEAVDPEKILSDLGLPSELAAAADDESWDELIKAESDEAFRRTGRDVGTPIITYGDGGRSIFGPVISSIPDDETSLQIYDAVKLLSDQETFSELKRSNRAPLDLPLLKG